MGRKREFIIKEVIATDAPPAREPIKKQPRKKRRGGKNYRKRRSDPLDNRLPGGYGTGRRR
ncbi:MAG TPA: hypothetical protein VHM88_22415 [Candidatus Acidoferrales bacterium]|nr:hypothetical protein [Candidatus Acidoferrales bacterium]